MSLYPDILFHFTQKRWLYKILSGTFKPSYARERIVGPGNEREFAVPMVSFCDLKLSEIKHFTSYGKFGIGLTKEWANRHELNPVMYMNRHCELMDNLITGVNGIFDYMDGLNDIDQLNELTPIYHNIINTYRYIKNYEGELWRKGKLVSKSYRFADEREWRFVPSIMTPKIDPFVPIGKIDTSNKKSFHNKKVNHISLHFEPDDIKYLIVKSDNDINPLISHLRNAKRRFPADVLSRLSSRILTIEQIKKDI